MDWPRYISNQFRHPLLIFGVTAAVLLLGTITWLSWRNFQQDKALLNQQIKERLDNTADLVTAALHEKYLEVDGHLTKLTVSSESDPTEVLGHPEDTLDTNAVVIILESGQIEAYPRENLLYYPMLPALEADNKDVFSAGENEEFQNQDYRAAAAFYRNLTNSSDELVRAGALMRLGRVLRKTNDFQSALSVYGELADSEIETIDGFPTELMARYARCVIYEQLDKGSELLNEAELIWKDLQLAQWKLAPSTYRFYEKKILNWLESHPTHGRAYTSRRDNALTLTAGVEELWRVWQNIQQGIVSPAGERNITINDSPVFLMWRGDQNRVVALVANPGFLETEWLSPVIQQLLDTQGARLALLDRDGNAIWGNVTGETSLQALRTASQAELPWTLQVASMDPTAVIGELKARRRLYWAWLAAMALLVAGSLYATARAVSRELAVVRLQGDFVSAVSHEFRTPLASLCHMTDLLAEGRVASDKRRHEYYTAMKSESERLHRLVVGLLDFRRMEEGAHEYRMEWINTSMVLKTVAQEFAQEARTTGYEVDIEIEDSLPAIHADQEALARAIWNLLDNAVKYSPDCLTVRIKAYYCNNHVIIQVDDQGIGISKAEQGRIFEKFFRAGSAKAAKIKGTGLGLAMVKHIVTNHGGQLSLESTIGAGSRFTIELPVERRME